MNRLWATRLAAPAAFLLGITVAILLVRAGLDGNEATRRMHEQGATVFEATSADVIAGQSYIGQLEAKEVLSKTEQAWRETIKSIGKRKLQAELADYKAAFPDIDVPG